MTYPAVQPWNFAIEPDDPQRDELEATEREIFDDDAALLAAIRDGDPTETVEDLVRAAAENRIANRKRLEAEDRGERLYAAANDYC